MTDRPGCSQKRGKDILPSYPAPARPDQDGPHDVPDDQVIDKTLPNSPADRGRPT
jgi:hypothetical protein